MLAIIAFFLSQNISVRDARKTSYLYGFFSLGDGFDGLKTHRELFNRLPSLFHQAMRINVKRRLC